MNGSTTVSPTATTTYHVSCGGSANATATVTVSGTLQNASTTYCASNGGGNGSSGSPWLDQCISAAVTAASAGDTVYLSAGNWSLPTTGTAVTISKAINLVGAGSGNTFDAYGHPAYGNTTSTDLCPTSGTITCIYTSGSTSCVSTGGSNPQGNSCTGGWIKFEGSGGNCNVSLQHVFVDGSQSTAGGDNVATVNFQNCTGPGLINDIRAMAYSDAGNFNQETQFSTQVSNHLTVTNSVFTETTAGIVSGFYPSSQIYEPVIDANELVSNNVFFQFFYNPTNNDTTTYTGNVSVFYNDTHGSPGTDPSFGYTGCELTVNCQPNSGTTGNYHLAAINNYFYAPSNSFGTGGGVNDPNTGGGVSDLNWTGNWIFAQSGAIAGCQWRFFSSCVSNQTNSNADGMQVNGTGGPSGNCSIDSSGTCFNITNNSIIATTTAELDAQGNGIWGSGNPDANHNTTTVNFNAHQNYLSSPSNQYLHDVNSINPSVTNNVGAGTNGQGQMDVAASSFTTSPTCSFTAGTLSGSTLPITGTSFTAQYGAVQYITSTSSTTPTSGDARWNVNGLGGGNDSYIPPVSLSSVSHGSTVYMWVMDSANHIASCGSVAVP